MAYNEAGYNASKKYKEKNIKRVPLDMQIDEYNKVKAAAERAGEKVNTYYRPAHGAREVIRGSFDISPPPLLCIL